MWVLTGFKTDGKILLASKGAVIQQLQELIQM
jgi:hypothetical protein